MWKKNSKTTASTYTIVFLVPIIILNFFFNDHPHDTDEWKRDTKFTSNAATT
jgi:hypothetical protein